MINENLLFYTMLKSVICFKSLIMGLTPGKLSRIYYFMIRCNKNCKGMINTKHQ